MANELLIGVDLGTTAAKAGLFDLSGAALAQAEITYSIHRPLPGRAEQDPEEWWLGLQTILSAVATNRASDVRGIGICSQVNTHIFADEHGQPVGPAILWQDTRCGPIAASLNETIAAATTPALARYLVDASSPVARAEWVSQHEPKQWAMTRLLLSPKDYLNCRLTGAAATDALSSIGLVGRDGHYLPEVLALVPGLAEVVPPIRDFRAAVGTANGLTAQGLNGAAVAVATMDAWGNLFGSGAYSAGDAIYVAGTSEILGVLSPAETETASVVAFPPVDGLTLYAGPTQAGGASLQWFASVVGLTIPDVLARAEASPPGSEDLVFLPYLAGERAPIWDSTARGVFFGLSAEHGIEHMCRAVIEGVAFSARHLLEELDAASCLRPNTLRLSGGGSRSDFWCQVRADILGRALERTRVRHSGTLGAALIAGVASGAAPSLQTAISQAAHADAVFEPHRSNKERYDELYGIYRDLYPSLTPLYRRVAKAQDARSRKTASTEATPE